MIRLRSNKYENLYYNKQIEYASINKELSNFEIPTRKENDVDEIDLPSIVKTILTNINEHNINVN